MRVMPNVVPSPRAETAGCRWRRRRASGGILRGQSRPIIVAGKPVEIVVASVSPSTVRITVLPVDGPLGGAGRRRAGERGGRAGRSAGGARRSRCAPIRAGDLTVRFTAEPPAIHIDTAAGQPVQRLTLDRGSVRRLVSARQGTAAGPRRRRAAVRSQGQRRSRAQRAGRLPAADARRPRADPVARRHRRLGHVHPSAARRVRFHRRRRASSRRRPTRCRSTCSSPRRRIRRRSCASTRGSPATRSCRRSGRSATCSRTARSPVPTRSCGSRGRSARSSCRATRSSISARSSRRRDGTRATASSPGRRRTSRIRRR